MEYDCYHPLMQNLSSGYGNILMITFGYLSDMKRVVNRSDRVAYDFYYGKSRVSKHSSPCILYVEIEHSVLPHKQGVHT
ncbi:hypothetical protein RchiOBHm_Chr1g0336951 [Rosa chinensis]|uniref:Uncharacterized protein n=1 Tax=Rosa chinensis TaxID=74649 RepID=A0A2P6SCT1_ROSCH|nr:hypothetical protein RchiOBHm_Chr1g0336951 [Rosa chinensis]